MIERNLDLCKAVLEGFRRFLAGEKYKVSSGIDGSMTYGYGELDEFGFWEYPVWEGLIELGRASVLKAELARVNKLNDTLVGERDRLREIVQKISEQRVPKPDYWSSCGQCDHNIEDAIDLLEANERRDALAGGSERGTRCDCYPSKENWMVCRYCGKDLGDTEA